MHDSVHALGRRAAGDPHFLASALAAYAAAHELDEAGLAAALGATADALTAARLCPLPPADPDRFREEVARIADRFGLNRDVLAAIVRFAHVTAKVTTDAEAGAEAAVLAARDRKTP